MSRKMSKDIKELVLRANKAMQTGTLEENKKLRFFIDSILLEKNMYHGFNYFIMDNLPDGTFGPRCINVNIDKDHWDSDGFFHEQQTDIIQFYVV